MYNALIIFLILMFVISLTYVNINFSFHRKKDDDNIQLQVKLLFGLLRFRFNIPYVDLVLDKERIGIKLKEELGTDKKETSEKKDTIGIKRIKKQYKMFIKVVKKYDDLLKYLLSHTKCDDFNWHIAVGIGDAAYSAYLTSILYTITYGFISIASSYIRISSIKILVVPDYNRLLFETDLNCIFRIKIVNIITVGMRLFSILLKEKFFHKGGVNNERPSY